MRRISIGIPVVVLFLIAVLALAGALIWTSNRYRQVVQTENDRRLEGFAKEGNTLPILSGHSIDGTPFAVLPTGTEKFLLMVFRQDCGYCNQNWPSWDRILADGDIRQSTVLYTTDDKIAAEYNQEHPNIVATKTLLGAAPKVTADLRLSATPQTLLVERGRITGIWPGVLSSDEVEQIVRAMKE